MTAVHTKRWSVNAISHGQEPLQVFCDSRPLTQSKLATIDNVSPVEFLLVSVATCFALSVRAALAARKLTRLGFEVVVLGEKAPDPPSRLKHIAVVAIFRGNLTEADAAAIAADAKRLCTVTNSLQAAPTISIGGRPLATEPAATGH
jgi:uncharacterized OsmC-like protein